MKNPEKLAFLSFNWTAVFLYNVTVSENDVIEAWYQSCHFSWFAAKPSWFAAKPQDFFTVSCEIFNLAVSWFLAEYWKPFSRFSW